MFDSKLITSFSSLYEPPYWVIEDLLEEGPSTIRAALEAAVASVPATTVEHLQAEERAQAKICFRTTDPLAMHCASMTIHSLCCHLFQDQTRRTGA
jgi:hypothetical protein